MLARIPDFRSRNEEMIAAIREKYIDTDRKVPIEAAVEVKEGRQPLLKLSCRGITVTMAADTLVTHAEKRPVTENDIREKISKFGGTDFELCRLSADVDDGIFVPVKALNELRRNAADELKRRLLAGSC